MKIKKPLFILGIKTKVIEDYIKLAEEKDMRILNIQEHGADIIIRREEIKKETPFRIIPAPLNTESSKESSPLLLADQTTPSQEQAKKPEEENTKNYSQIKAPFVGTFYRKPSPDADSFVKEGDIVNVGQTLCILEAMKVMNKINSDVKGRIVKIMAEDTKPVKKDDILFLIEPVA
ncbi:MAG: acetyl-CoA carboxylase biotin carboxyl carrier protein [bacterium]|nr:acetyl-CoA carboxylase biotin carboxyl carrier protein [bacterium]